MGYAINRNLLKTALLHIIHTSHDFLLHLNLHTNVLVLKLTNSSDLRGLFFIVIIKHYDVIISQVDVYLQYKSAIFIKNPSSAFTESIIHFITDSIPSKRFSDTINISLPHQ